MQPALGTHLLQQGRAAEAEAWLRPAAGSGNVEAVAYLGAALLQLGKRREAERLLRSAARAGHRYAAHVLGLALLQSGRRRDRAEAETWLRFAGVRGSA